MSCTQPIYALKLGAVNPQTGKERIKILPRRIDASYRDWCDQYGEENILQLPCGHCESCIEKRTRAWAVRCVLEAAQYENNCFLTLTYSDRHLPKGGLCKSDLQKFIRKLRDFTGKKIRYFACGEYGEHTYRPHYHLIVFNWFPEDARFLKESKYGGYLFWSETLMKLWPHGISSVGEVTFASCGYVARYCQKKLAKKEDNKEFCLMSRRPGIGEAYAHHFLEEIYDTDKIYLKNGKSASTTPSRYFDKLYEAVDPVAFEVIKNERINKSRLSIASDMLRFGFDHVEKLYKYQGALKKDNFDKLKRRI